MKVNVKTYATLSKYSPVDTKLGESFKINIEGEKILNVVEKLGIPPKEELVVLVNGIRITNLEYILKTDDLIVIFPRLGGG